MALIARCILRLNKQTKGLLIGRTSKIELKYRIDSIRPSLYLIFTSGGSAIRNSWATRTIRELFLFKRSYILSLYGKQLTDLGMFTVLLSGILIGSAAAGC